MKIFHTPIRIAILLNLALLPSALGGPAGDSALQARLEERQPEVRQLLNKQLVGENNRGYLEVRGSALHEVHQIVADENSDRLKLYTALAAETGEKVEEIGRQRAADAALQAKRGHWIQDRSGAWRQK